MNLSSILGHKANPEVEDYLAHMILNFVKTGEYEDGKIARAIVPTNFENLDLIPAIRSYMVDGDDELTLASVRGIAVTTLFDSFLSEIEEQYDYILFDIAEGGATKWCANAFNCSDYILVPIDTDQSNIDGYTFVVDKIDKEIKRSNRKIKILGAFVNRYKRDSVSNSLVKACQRNLGSNFIPVCVRDALDVKKAHIAKMPVCYYAPASNAAKDFGELAYQILTRIEGEPDNKTYKRYFGTQAECLLDKMENNSLVTADITFEKVSPSLLYDNPLRIRTEDDDEVIQTIIESIEENGYLEDFPVLAFRMNENDYYTIADGHRRRDAALATGIEEVPVIRLKYPSFGLIEGAKADDEEKKALKQEAENFYKWINKGRM